MHAVDESPPRQAVTVDPYAPFAVRADAAAWHLTRTVVHSVDGPVVVHHRPGRDPLLLLHGVAGSWTTWTPLLQAADGVAPLQAASGVAPLQAADGVAPLQAASGVADRGLVLVDLPGWGSSPAPREPLDTAAVVSVLVDVLDALGVPTVDVVGHSMGAFVAMEFAVAVPGRVRSVALVSGTTVATADAARHPLRGLLTLPAFTLLRAGLTITGERARPVLRWSARVGLLPLLAAPVFTHVRGLDPSVLAAFVDELRPSGFTGAARAAGSTDLGRWCAVTCPVTAIAGRDDVFARTSDLEALRGLLPQVRTVLLDDCGHFAHVERPQAVARVLGLV